MRIKIPRQAGQAVKSRRMSLGLTQSQLASRSGVSLRLVSSLELGTSPGIQLDKLMAILTTLDLGLFIQDAEASNGQSMEPRAPHAISESAGRDVSSNGTDTVLGSYAKAYERLTSFPYERLGNTR